MEVRRLVLGERPGARRRYGAVAVALGVLAAVVPVGVRVSGALSGPGSGTEAYGAVLLLLAVVGLLALAVPVAAGYRGAGLAVCVAVPTCLVLGVNVAYWTSAGTLRVPLWQWAGLPLGVLLGVPPGAAGYLVGAGLHRLRGSGPAGRTRE